MSERARQVSVPRSQEAKAPGQILTKQRVKALMQAAAPGSAELDRAMKPLFQLSGRHASIRLK